MRKVLVVGSLALAAMVWSGVAAQQQEMQARPGPGSGVTRVTGSVDIGEMPDVHALQRGEWRVGITGVPEVRVAGPAFIRLSGRYEITWQGGERESVSVAEVSANGWVRVANSRWVNLGYARSVEMVGDSR